MTRCDTRGTALAPGKANIYHLSHAVFSYFCGECWEQAQAARRRNLRSEHEKAMVRARLAGIIPRERLS